MTTKAIDSLEVRIGSRVDQALEGLDKVGVKAQQVGKNLRRMGFRLTRSLTVPLAALGGASFKAAADFEQSMGRIEGLVGVQRSQLEEWRGDIRRLAADYGKSGAEAAEALFFITSAGLRGSAAMETLEASLKGSAAGLGDVKTIADLSTSALNAYGSENLSAAEATDVLTMAVREGKLEPAELGGAMGRVIPIAAAMGIQFDEVGAALAAMSRTGTAASEGATQLRAIMAGILKPTQDSEQALSELGLSSAGLREQIKEEGLLSVLQTLKERIGDNDAMMARVFPNIRSLAGVMDMMGENSHVTAEIFDSLSDSSGALDDALAAMETGWRKLNRMVGKGIHVLQEVGDTVIDAVSPALDLGSAALGKLADFIAGLPTPVKRASVVFGTLLGTLGPVAMVAGRLIPLVSTLGKALLAAATGPIGLTIAAVGSLVFAGAQLIEHWDGLKLNANIVWTTIKEAVFNAVDGILRSIERLVDFIPSLEEKIQQLRERFNAYADESLVKSRRRTGELAAAMIEAGDSAEEADEGFEVLQTTIDDLGESAAGASGGITKPVEDAITSLHSSLAQAAAMNDLLGDSFDHTEARADAYKSAIQALVEAGADFDMVVGPQGETLREIADRYLDLESSIEGAREEQRELERAQKEAAKITRGVRTEAEIYRDTVRNLQEHLEAGRITQETFNRAVRQAAEDYREARKEGEQAGKSVEETFVNTADRGIDAFADFATGAENAISNFVDAALRDLSRLIARMLIVRTLTSIFPGVGSLLSSGTSLAARAHGGPVQRNRPYLVGERGPELVVPNMSGQVVPNRALEGGPSASDVAGEILARVGDPPGPTSPEVAATHDYYRRLFSEMVEDGKRRGVRFD